MTDDPADDVLFCTDRFWADHADRVRELAPDLDVVTLDGDERVAEDDLQRITLAFFSADAWPERAANFMTVALQSPRLRWLHTMSAGVDSPVFSMFLDRGARLTTSSGSSAEPIAGTAMMYLLALSRGLPRLLQAQHDHDWAWQRWDELAGRSIAIAGWGPIGREVARLASAFGMRPTIVRRRAVGDEPHPVRRLDDLAGVAADHDVLVVALPLTPETRGIVSTEVLDALGPRGLFVNVGRGELVDQIALTEALVDGRLGGAGIDVTDPEPLPEDDPLWEAPNLILTPHSSGSSDGTARRADEVFLDNLGRWVRSESLRNEVQR